jgi:hypothetical protein
MKCLGAALALVVVSACGSQKPESKGRVRITTQASSMLPNQSFCFTWTVYQEPTGGGTTWDEIDSAKTPVCSDAGVDTASGLATCYDGRRFLVDYEITFYDYGVSVGKANATSGGGAADLCVMDKDTPTQAVVQFGNQGGVGGVNPGIGVDAVCFNHKNDFECADGSVGPQCLGQPGTTQVSALWVSPSDCNLAGTGTPDSYCVMQFGGNGSVYTADYGTTPDGKVNYIFNRGDPTTNWALMYFIFDPAALTGGLTLFDNLSTLFVHESYALTVSGSLATYAWSTPIFTWIYDQTSIGMLQAFGGNAVWLYDLSPNCMGPIDGPGAADAVVGSVSGLTCSGSGQPVAKGAVPLGGSAFEIVYECPGGEFYKLPCDALAPGGQLCTTFAPL